MLSLWLPSLLLVSGLPDRNGSEVWCSPLIFWTLPLELVHTELLLSKKLSLLSWPLVFCRYFSFGILNTRFCVIKHNIALWDKHLEFICVKSEHRLVEDWVYKMITLLLDLIKFFRTPNSS